jgi:hypothetical protein
MTMRSTSLWALLVMLSCGAAQAADIGVAGGRLVVRDTTAVNGRASVTYSLRNQPGIQKGPAGSTTNLEATIEVFYTDDPCNGSKFILPPGASWRVNSSDTARYRIQRTAGAGAVQRVMIRNGKDLRAHARALGDEPSWKLDLAAGTPSATGGITAIVTIRNGNDASTHRMCTRFASIDGSTVSLRATAGGRGRMLVATGGVAVSCDQPAALRMEPGLERGFFAAPWPNDTRTLGNGSLDMASFPLPPGNAIAETILTRGSAVTKGFGTNSAVFFQTCGPVDRATLPTPEASILSDSTVMLVNLDNPSAPRIPLLLNLEDTVGELRPPDLLSILPYPGHPLAGKTRYAAILFAGIHTAHGAALSPSPLLAELDDPWDVSKPVDATRWAALQTQRDDVYDYVDNHTGWTAADVIAFTVYTTQDVVGEMQAIAAAVNALPSPTPVSRTTGNCSGGVHRTTVSGVLHLPRWQAGVFPFLFDGGDIVIMGGQAVQQSTETATFRMTFPCGAAPANGWPILLFMDGTGAGANSSNISYMGGSSSTNPLPYVVASIAPLYSGDRFVAGLPPPFNDSEFLFFNYFNALAGRTNQLQQAADMMYLRRVVEGIQLSAAETGNASPVPTDDSIEMIAGHSQGALTVPHILAVDTAFDAGFISAGGGGLYETILHRGDVRSLLAVVIGPASNELDMFHPLLHALQTFAEVGDAANYAQHVQTAHVLSTSGLLDGCSPVEVGSILGTAMGLEVANPLYHPMFGSATLEPPTTTLPAAGNLAGGRTGITVQLNTGHFGSVTNPGLGRSFADSLATGAIPTVNASPLFSDTIAGCPRYDPLP